MGLFSKICYNLLGDDMKLLDGLGKAKKAIGGIVAIIVVGVIIFLIGMHFGGKSSEPEITSASLGQQIENIEELSTLSYHYSKVGQFSNNLKLNGWSIPLTQKKFLLSYEGELKVGVKLDQAKISVDDSTITVSLPEITFLSHEIDENSIEVYDETKNIFNQISIKDYKAFAKKQKSKVEEEAIENGILSKAATRTQKVITQYLESLPNIKNHYTIKIEFQKKIDS